MSARSRLFDRSGSKKRDGAKSQRGSGDIRRRRLNLEPLESRTLLSGSPLVLPSPPQDGTPDSMELRLNGVNLEYWVNAGLVDSQPLAGVSAVTINGTDDADTLDINFSGGNPIPGDGVLFNGGNGFDSLILSGGATTSVTHAIASPNDGTITLAGPLAGAIAYTGLAPVADNVSATDRVFTFLGGAETITLADDLTPGNGFSTIDSTLGEAVTFVNPTGSLRINAGTGIDIINVEGLDPTWSADVIVNGDGDDDSVNFQTNPTNLGAGDLTVTAETVAVNVSLTAATVSIASTGGRPIDLGTETIGSLSLTDDELDLITATTLRIGGIDSGAIDISDPISPAGTSVLHLTSGDSIVEGDFGGIVVANLAAEAPNIYLNNETENAIDVFAAEAPATGDVSLMNVGDLIVGTVDGVTGATGLSVFLWADNGDLTVLDTLATNDVAAIGPVDLTAAGTGRKLTLQSGSSVVAGGELQMRADRMALGGTATGSSVVLGPTSVGRLADLGSTSDATANRLELSDAELDRVTAPDIVVYTLGGSIVVSDVVDRGSATILVLLAGAGGNIQFDAGPTPGRLDNAAGRVLLWAPLGAIISGGAVTDVTADRLDMEAYGDIGSSANPLTMSVNTLASHSNISDDPLGGDQYLSELNSLSVVDDDDDSGGDPTLAELDVSGGMGAVDGTIYLAGGTFLTTTTGSIAAAVVVRSGATLGGNGTVDGPVSVLSGGTVAPGLSPGILNTGDVSFSSGSTFSVEINGPTPGTGYDQLSVTGTVSLGMATLSLSKSVLYSIPAGQVFVIINNDGSDPVVSRFTGLPNGSWITAGGQLFRITYNGGTGNDVTLTAVAPFGQYATRVVGFSSQYSTTQWSAARSLGPPDVGAYGDHPNAWAARFPNTSSEFLTVGFDTAVYATGFSIWETYGNGFVTLVEFRDTTGAYHTVWSGPDGSPTGVPAELSYSFSPPTSYLVDTVRITVNGNHSSGWEEIDAVQLRGVLPADGVIVTPTSGLVTTELGGTALFTVALSSPPTSNVVIGLSSSDTTEGTVSPPSMTFTPDDWNVPQTATVTGVDDVVTDGDTPYTIVTAPAVSADLNFSGVNPADVSVTNLDNGIHPSMQYATSVIAFSSQYSSTGWSAAQALFAPDVASYGDRPNAWAPRSADNTAEFLTLGFDTPVHATGVVIRETYGNGFVTQVEVRNAATGVFESVWTGTDLTPTGAPTDFVVSFPARVYLVDAVRISLNTRTNGIWEEIDAVQLQGLPTTGGVLVSPTSGLITTEAAGTDSFTVVLTSPPTASVTIGLSSSDATEGTVLPPSVTFNALNWNMPQTVTVTGVDDLVTDGNTPYTIVTAPAVSADLSYSGINPSDVSVTNLDNEAPPPTQYATSVLGFSSQYSSTRWSAAQALFAPNVLAYRDDPNAWAPVPMDGTTEFLTLGFSTPVYASGVVVRESLGNGFVTKVEVRNAGTGVFETVWTGVDTTPGGTPTDFVVSFPTRAYLVNGVKITVDTKHNGIWEEIDAVKLLGNTFPPPAPMLAAVGDKVVDEAQPLVFSAAAERDPSAPALAYSLDAASVALGMSIDPATGQFAWTPAQGQAGKYSATITANQSGDPPVSETFSITVGDVVDLPAAKRGYNLVLRRGAGDATRLEIVNANGRGDAYWSAPADQVFKLTIRGLDKAADTLSVDFVNGPIAIEGGVVFDGKGGAGADALVIKTTVNGATAGDDTIEVANDRVVVNGMTIGLAGVESVTLNTGAGNDRVAVSGLTANVVWIDSAGTDGLNFSQAVGPLTLNLDSTGAQKVLAGNTRTLTLRGTVENAIGTAAADLIRGNKAANRIEGGGDNDTLYGAGGRDTLYGGDGDDWLYGDAGDDTLYGEAGNNVLLGGDGNDLLEVITGVRIDDAPRNLVIGGKGADKLYGGNGDEILIGGATNYDNRAAALAAVMQVWTSDKGFKQRCDLLAGGFTTRGAGFIQLKQTTSAVRGTILNDAAMDVLYGRGGNDWFLGFAPDKGDRNGDDR